MPVELVETVEIDAAEWAALWERCPQATPFQHPGWIEPWWRHLWGGGKQWWMALRAAGRLVGVAPLFVWGEPPCVSPAGAGISDYLDLLIEPEHAREGAACVLEHLARHRDRWEICEFPELRTGFPLPEAMPAAIVARVEPSSVCPVVRLPAALSKRLYYNLHRASNRIARAGGVLETASHDNLDEWLTALFRLHTARWKLRGEPGVLDDARVQTFHREAARRLLEAGLLRLFGLRLDGEPAAVVYGMAAKGRYYSYLGGFDPAHARMSPATVLIGHAMHCAAAEGLAEFDFLREREAFKYEWGAEDRSSRRLVLRHA